MTQLFQSEYTFTWLAIKGQANYEILLGNLKLGRYLSALPSHTMLSLKFLASLFSVFTWDQQLLLGRTP